MSETAADPAAVVLMVREVEMAAPLGVTLAGENVQLEPAGRPLQANVTVETTPFMGTTEIVNMARWPALVREKTEFGSGERTEERLPGPTHPRGTSASQSSAGWDL